MGDFPSAESMAEALVECKLRLPLPEQGFTLKRWLLDNDAIEFLFQQMGNGYTVEEFCREAGMGAGAPITLRRWMKKLQPGEEWFDEYQLALRGRAAHFADRILDVCHQVEAGVMTPAMGTMITKNLQWLASRTDPGTWSEKLSVEHSGSVDSGQAHLEAVRALAHLVKAQKPVAVIDGQVVNREPLDAYEGLLD